MAIWVWPILAMILIATIWILIESKLAQQKKEVRQNAFIRAASVATSYAGQIERTLMEVDRTTILASQLWSVTNGQVKLNEYYQKGVFPKSFFHVSIGNRDGDVVTSTLPLPQPINFGNRSWFQAHRSGRFDSLLISERETGPRTGRPIVRISRPIFDNAGQFDGAVWVTLEPPYLTAFFGGHQLQKDEFISIRLTTGPLLTTDVGGHDGAPKIFYRHDPAFSALEGVKEETAEMFVDEAPRIVAWKKLDLFPVVAIAGLKQEEVYSAYARDVTAWRTVAVIGTLLLMAFGALAAYFSTGLAARKREARQVVNTYRLAVDAAQEGFYMLKPIYDAKGSILDFRVEDCNERAAALIGVLRDQVLHHSLSRILPQEYERDTVRVLRRVMEIGFHEEELRVPSSPDSARSPTWLYRRFMKSENGVAMVVRDISAMKEHERELVQLANTDTLTSLPNRYWLLTYLPDALRRANEDGKHVAILFMDLDDFKDVNDTLGHDAGDELLRQAVARLRGAIRSSDHIARLGGDEFTIVLEHLEEVEHVAHVARTVIAVLAKPFTLKEGTDQRIKASIGISMYPDDGMDGETLLKHADIAMYAAKAGGKGQFRFYESHLSDALILRLKKENSLREAVERDEFVVYFQPRVNAKSGQLSSMEALVRWMHPEHGIVFPSEFIDIAEDTGLIHRLGELVIEKVCLQIAKWKEQGFPMVPISVNISPQQLRDGTVSCFIAQCMRLHNIEADFLEVELTESAVIDSSQVVMKELEQLRALGVKLMIDDFGKGHSSLAQLHGLDVDTLKVDKAFTDALCSGSEGRVLYQAIVSMAEALGMCVVAEGVETTEQLHILQELKCDEIQGYIVSEAVSAERMSLMLANKPSPSACFIRVA